MMWVHAGFSPDAFWRQSPRNFQLAMRGIRKSLKDQSDEKTRQAWESAAFTAATQTHGGLKPLSHYLKSQAEPQTAKQLLNALKTLQSSGADMTFRRQDPNR